MNKKSDKVKIVFLGSDENIYGSASELHKEFSIVSDVISAGTPMWATRDSSIINLIPITGINDDELFESKISELTKIYENYDGRVILVGSGDHYAKILSQNKKQLEKSGFIVPYADWKKLKELFDKDTFYKIAKKNNISIPDTLLISPKKKVSLKKIFYPHILKAVDADAWALTEVEDKQKVYLINNEKEFESTWNKIINSKFNGEIAIQEYLDGTDELERNITAYVDSHNEVQVITLGQPILEDPSPKATGNHVAILPAFDKKIYQQYSNFINSLKYTGFINIDLKWSKKDKVFKALDLNPRLGRSNFWATLNGVNWMSELLRDYGTGILPKRDKLPEFANENIEPTLWLEVSEKTFNHYARDNDESNLAKKLIKEKRFGHSYLYKKDNNLNRLKTRRKIQKVYDDSFRKNFKE